MAPREPVPPPHCPPHFMASIGMDVAQLAAREAFRHQRTCREAVRQWHGASGDNATMRDFRPLTDKETETLFECTRIHRENGPLFLSAWEAYVP